MQRDWRSIKQEFGEEIIKEPTVVKTGLPPALSYIIREIRIELGKDFSKDEGEYTQKDFCDLIDIISVRHGFELSSFERDEILEQLEKEQKPFGVLQSLVDSPEISDIIITDFDDVSVQQKRKNYKTDITFPNKESYINYVERLLQKAGTTYSTAHPITDGTIGGFVRVHAVHQSICEKGPYLTLRINRFSKVKVEDLIKYSLAPKEVFDYLNAAVKSGLTIFIAGEVGTGKTTLVRALASSIFKEESILVIEDTPEIILEHPHVRYLRIREANTDNAGLISPAECIRAGMRMAMNRIIFGEIRDARAAEAFIDVCASGHSGMSTIHAKSSTDAISRLELFLGRAQKMVANNILKEQIASAVQIIVHLDICHNSGFRRIMDVREITSMADNVVRQREIFKYSYQNQKATWKVVSKTSSFEEDFKKKKIDVNLRNLKDELVID